MDYEAAIDEFARVAREFCAWVETSAMDDEAAILQASSHLARLYASALALPGVDETYLPWPPDVPDLGDEAKRAIATRLRAFPMQYYWEVFHALTADADAPCLGDLADDLLDTYCDVKEGLAAMDDEARVLAVWHWRTTFGFHWGRHVVSALKALHDFDSDSPLVRARPT